MPRPTTAQGVAWERPQLAHDNANQHQQQALRPATDERGHEKCDGPPRFRLSTARAWHAHRDRDELEAPKPRATTTDASYTHELRLWSIMHAQTKTLLTLLLAQPALTLRLPPVSTRRVVLGSAAASTLAAWPHAAHARKKKGSGPPEAPK